MSFATDPDVFMEIAFGADGKSLLTVTARQIKRWNLGTGENDRTIVLGNNEAENDEFSLFAFTPDGKHLVSAQRGEDRFSRNTRRCLWRVRLWDAATGRRLADFPDRRGDRSERKELSPDGRTLAVGSDTGILLYRIGSYLNAPERQGDDSAMPGAPLALKCRAGQIWSLAFSPDGKTLASTWASEANIKIWDVETGRNIYTLKNQKPCSTVAFGPDGKTLASKDKQHVVKLWDWP
jgi:WD40 repeat protein